MYSPLDARRAAGYIHVKRRDAGVILGQVCAVAVYLPSRLAEDAQRYTLLLETSKHTLEWETSDSEQEAIYELQESRQRLKEEYDIEITMPANAAWNWSSPDTQFEFFDGQNGQNDVVLIAIELAEGQPLPHPTIMPDTNNVVARDWSCGTNLFGSVFRSRGDRKNRQLDITFTGMSVEIEGGLRHQVEAADGDSGGMLYHSAGDSGTLFPVGVITGKWKGPAFSVSQVDVLQKLLGETGKTLEERNTRVIFDDFISALSTRQLPDPMRRLDRPSNTAASRIQGIGETPDEHVQPRLYSRKQALQAAGYIRVKKTDDDESVWSGQVCAVAVFLHSCLAGDTQRYTLLVLTSKHTLEWEPSDSESETESETIYGLEGGSRRLKEEYGIEIIMPANEAWNWSSPDTLFEFFADENDQHDVALIAIELAKDEPLPHPTIMPDINNVVLGDWSHGTNFFGIVFRSGNGGEAEGEEMFPHYVDFKSSSVELGGTLHHQAKTEEGGSGGMLYCYADDPEKLVPACVITVQWIGVDHSHTYSVKQVGALQTLWKMTRQTLDERNSRTLYCETKFASSDRRPQPPAPMRHPEQPFYMALSRLEFICDFFSDATGHIVPYSLEQSRQTTGYINAGNRDHPQIKLGVVSGIAAFVHSRLAGDSQRYTLLLLTCQRALKWADTHEPSAV